LRRRIGTDLLRRSFILNGKHSGGNTAQSVIGSHIAPAAGSSTTLAPLAINAVLFSTLFFSRSPVDPVREISSKGHDEGHQQKVGRALRSNLASGYDKDLATPVSAAGPMILGE
jgi:hypothetical protein